MRAIAPGPGEACEKQHEEYDAFAVLLRRVEACLSEGFLDPSAGAFETATVLWASVHGLSVLGREGALSGMAAHREPMQRESPHPGPPSPREERNAGDSLMKAFCKIYLRSEKS